MFYVGIWTIVHAACSRAALGLITDWVIRKHFYSVQKRCNMSTQLWVSTTPSAVYTDIMSSRASAVIPRFGQRTSAFPAVSTPLVLAHHSPSARQPMFGTSLWCSPPEASDSTAFPIVIIIPQLWKLLRITAGNTNKAKLQHMVGKIGRTDHLYVPNRN